MELYDIICRGSNVIVFMNGWKVLDVDISLMTMPIGKFDTPLAQLPPRGYLQLHGPWRRGMVSERML